MKRQRLLYALPGGGGEGEEEKAGSLPSSGSLLTHSSCVCLCVCAYAGDSPCCPTISEPLEKVRAGRKGRGRRSGNVGGVLLAASWRHNRLVRQLQQCFINSLAAPTCLSLPSSLSLLLSLSCAFLPLSFPVTAAVSLLFNSIVCAN